MKCSNMLRSKIFLTLGGRCACVSACVCVWVCGFDSRPRVILTRVKRFAKDKGKDSQRKELDGNMQQMLEIISAPSSV